MQFSHLLRNPQFPHVRYASSWRRCVVVSFLNRNLANSCSLSIEKHRYGINRVACDVWKFVKRDLVKVTFYRPQTKLGQDNVLALCVILLTGRGVVCVQGVCIQGVCIKGGLHPWGLGRSTYIGYYGIW